MTKATKPLPERMRYRLEEVENGWIVTISVVTGAVEGGVLRREVYGQLGKALGGISQHWHQEVLGDLYEEGDEDADD